MKLKEFQKVTEMLSREHKIQVHEGRGWAANIKERDVFYVKNDVFNLPEEHILGLLLHETAHIHYTTVTPKQPKNPELIHSAMNMLEDNSIEYIISDDYPNAGEILESTKQEVLDTLVRILPTLENTPKHEKAMLYASARFGDRGYDDGFLDYEKVGDKIAEIMIQKKIDILERKKTSDLLPLAKQIVDILIKEFGEPTAEEKRQMARDNQTHGEANESTDNKRQGEIIEGLKGGKGWGGGSRLSTQIGFVNEIVDQANQIGKELRTVLKRNNAMEFGGRYRTGKLLTKRIARIKILKDRNPFARRVIKSNQSYAFAVASDVSGSMCGNYGHDPASYALSSMFMVGEALRFANVNRAMIIFGENAITVNPMNKTQIRWEELNSHDKIKEAGQGDTNINEAINKCAEELNKIRAERKVMIILTDGSSDLNEMKEAHKKATKQGIECLSIVIGYNHHDIIETFSKEKTTVIDNWGSNNSIGKAFIDILRTSIQKSL